MHRTRAFALTSVALLVVSLGFVGCRKAPEELPAAASAQPATPTLSADHAPIGERGVVKPVAVAKAASCPSDPEGGRMLPTQSVSFPDKGLRVDAEIAKSEHDVTRGLMYRTEMPENHGMLFRMHARTEQVFWMRNTCIPLDMLFIDDDGTIVGILENVPVLNEEQRTVHKPSRYVLELNAGYCAKFGIKAGMKANLPI